MKNLLKKNPPSFTLIETLIGITLMTVVITAVSGLILSTLLSNQRNIRTMQALYLAQESLEAMRFIRDSNWLQNYSWDGGKALWGLDFGSLSSAVYLKEEACPPCFSFSNTKEDGVVLMDDFAFTRSIETDSSTVHEDTVEVTARLEWQERGKERSLELSTYLSNWQ